MSTAGTKPASNSATAASNNYTIGQKDSANADICGSATTTGIINRACSTSTSAIECGNAWHKIGTCLAYKNI